MDDSTAQPEPTPMFGPDDIISTYTDAQAVDDGDLCNVGGGDRVTHGLWAHLVREWPVEGVPSRWPVPLLRYVKAPTTAAKVMLAAKCIIDDYRQETVSHWKQGEILSAFVVSQHNVIRHFYPGPMEPDLHWTQTACEVRKVWFLPNENNDGVTLMFPEDY